MQYMKSYYAFEVTIRYYAFLPKAIEMVDGALVQGTPGDLRGTLGTTRVNPSQWREPPHRVLANLPVNVAADENVYFVNKPDERKVIKAFIAKYGPLLGRRTLLPKDGAPQFYENVRHFKSFQDVLRRAWTGEANAIKDVENRLDFIPETYNEETKSWIGNHGKTKLSATGQQIEVQVTELERFICLLFLRDHGAGMTGVCKNPDCPAPYFLRARKGQTFCSHKCAVLINVRRFRERDAASKKRPKARKK